MIAKTFEVRDRATFIPILAVRMEPGNNDDRYLLGRSGFGQSTLEQGSYVMIWRMSGGIASTESEDFNNGARTMMAAHRYIKENFDTLSSGSVVDVEFICHEKDSAKLSESIL